MTKAKYGRADDSGLRVVRGTIITIRQRRTGVVLARMPVESLRDLVDHAWRGRYLPNLAKELYAVDDAGIVSVVH